MTNHYDSGGLLASVDGVKNGTAYRYHDRREHDQFLDRRFDQTRDGMLREYTYEAADRTLARLRTDTKQPPTRSPRGATVPSNRNQVDD